MSYVIKAVLSNPRHPEYGQTTIPFPIPDSEYDHTIELLEAMGSGAPTVQGCQVDELDSSYPILNRLLAQSVSVDELDYLAKRLDSFCEGEDRQFEAMAHKLGISTIKDFINLTFCCQQATVITNFADLEQIGRDHRMNINGGSMPVEECRALDGREEAVRLIESGGGTVTPYGVVYDNGMALEQFYNGRQFPGYFYKPPVIALEITPKQGLSEGQMSPIAQYVPAKRAKCSSGGPLLVKKPGRKRELTIKAGRNMQRICKKSRIAERLCNALLDGCGPLVIWYQSGP